MHWVDIAIVAILFLSSVIAIVRGFVKEFISLMTWLAAFFICMTFAGQLQPLLPDAISNPLLRQGVAWFLLFVATMITGGLVSFIVTSLVDRSGLSHTDRAMGFLFGLLRGVVIVCALVMLGVFIELNKANWWLEPKLLVYFQEITEWIVSFMPDSVAQKFDFTAGSQVSADNPITTNKTLTP